MWRTRFSSIINLLHYRELSPQTHGERNCVTDTHLPILTGKGSTASVIASVLRAAGYRVGVYTSPHLHHISERISTEEASHIRPEAFDALVS